MNTPIETAENNEAPASVSISALRDMAQQRLAGVQGRLEAKGVGAAFLRVAKVDPVGDMGFLSTLAFHAILCGPLEELMGMSMPFGPEVMGDFNAAALGVAEGMSLLKDARQQTRDAREGRGLGPFMSFYPKGRRKDPMHEQEKKVSRKFNRVAANQNGRFSLDVQSELACMFEIMDTLDKLEEQGAKEIRMDKGQKQISYARKGRNKADFKRMQAAI